MQNCTLCGDTKLKKIQTDFGKSYLECANCNLIFLNPSLLPTPSEEIARYSLHQNSPNDLKYCDFLRKVIDPLLNNINPQMTGLDYGCGPGPTISQILATKGIKIENYDPYFAPRKFLDTDRFDFLISTEAIEHFYNPKKEFSQIAQLVRPNGYVALMTEVFDGSQKFENWWYIREPTHVSIYQPKTLEWIATNFKWQMQTPHKNVRIYKTNQINKKEFLS